MRIRLLSGIPLLALAVVAGMTLPAGAQSAEDCAVCHEDVTTEFAKSSHAIGTWWDADQACTSCHGPGEAHMESTDPADLRDFEAMSVRDRSKVCMDCHQRSQHQFKSRYATHTLNQIGCMDCHSPHSTNPQLLEARGIQLCRSCHESIAGQFDMPRSHPMPDANDHLTNPMIPGATGCETCHNPHVEVFRTARGIRGAKGGFNCTNCHIEKAGPFVFPHDVAIVDGCQSCHEVHGSANRHLLKHERQVNLCYECHAADTTPGWHSAGRFVTEKCTTCHTAIHGSNTDPAFLED